MTCSARQNGAFEGRGFLLDVTLRGGAEEPAKDAAEQTGKGKSQLNLRLGRAHLDNGVPRRSVFPSSGSTFVTVGSHCGQATTSQSTEPWRIFMSAEGEMLPRWENRMTLHPTRTDGSCLASNGNPNSPSLTFMALTARAVTHAVELTRQNKL